HHAANQSETRLRLNPDNLKTLLKSSYLAQLRHGPFTTEKLVGIAETEITEAINSGHLTEKRDGNTTQLSLTDKGRREIKVVLAGGVYDVLHLGHLAALTEAKAMGDLLVTVVATDVTVEMLKGRRPLFPEEDRRLLVEGLKPVDKAILGYEDVGMGYEEVIMEVMPDLIAFGYDQQNLEKSVQEIIDRRKMKIKTVRLSRFEHEKYLSSTAVRVKLSEGSK
ncbi:MAG TPA: adenylyltransferase/cytidyltransferase family protein, partial [Candidatus Saccharimonadales bacterium]|nr:adenylyltransferase/cytidyltransferase family protein [Candidatus Saccharimonadales bacterium]